MKKVIKGYVVSDKMNKTIVVNVFSLKKHPIYKKYLKWNRNYKAHDEKNECQLGDFVKIIESKSISKGKSYRLLEIIKI